MKAIHYYIGLLAAFVGMTITAEAANVTEVKPSNAVEQHWYVIRNANRTNAVLTDEGAGAQVYGRVYSKSGAQMWRFIETSPGLYRIESRTGRMLSGSGATDELIVGAYAKTNTQMSLSLTSDKSKWSIVPTGQTANAVHFTRTATLPYYCITWQSSSVDSYWTLEEVSASLIPAVTQSDVDAYKTKLEAFRIYTTGNKMGELKSTAALDAAISNASSLSSLIGKSYSEFLQATESIESSFFVMPTPYVKEGAYALRCIANYPSLNYAAEGKYVARSTSTYRTSLILTNTFTNATARWILHSEGGNGIRLTSPGDSTYIYVNSSYIRLTNAEDTLYKNNTTMTLLMDRDTLNTETRVAWAFGTEGGYDVDGSVRAIQPTTIGTTLTCPTTQLSISSATMFQLIPLASEEWLNLLRSAIADARQVSATASGKNTATLDSIVTWAEGELNYVYLTPKDAVLDTRIVQDAVSTFKSSGTKAVATGVTSASLSQGKVTVKDHRILLDGKLSGFRIVGSDGKDYKSGEPLNSGVYVVTKNKTSWKVSVP